MLWNHSLTFWLEEKPKWEGKFTQKSKDKGSDRQKEGKDRRKKEEEATHSKTSGGNIHHDKPILWLTSWSHLSQIPGST